MESLVFMRKNILVLALSCAVIFNAFANERVDKLRESILSQINEPQSPQTEISILKFGKASAAHQAFQKAFQFCEKKGALKLIVPAGEYFVDGPLHLPDNIQIHFEKGAVLKFSSEPEKYLPVVKTSWEGTFLYNYSPLIYAYGKKNIIISGEGIINGNASEGFGKWRPQQKAAQMRSREMNHQFVPVEARMFGKGDFLRPHMIQFFDCKNVLLQDFHITNSPFWCVHLLKSENITVRGISFDAKNVNNDGIDPEYSRNILIENVDFNNGDDNVAIKAGRDYEGRATAQSTENILIRNCRFQGLHAVVIGSEMSAGVQNILVENCTYGGYCKRGIYIKSNPDRGGFVRNIYAQNLQFDEVEDLFYITSYYHGEGKGFATRISDIFIDNIYCRKARNAGIVIQGFETEKVRNVQFSNITVDSLKVGLSINEAQGITFSNVNLGGTIKEMPSFAD